MLTVSSIKVRAFARMGNRPVAGTLPCKSDPTQLLYMRVPTRRAGEGKSIAPMPYLDLEDAVGPRRRRPHALRCARPQERGLRPPRVVIRINALDTPWAKPTGAAAAARRAVLLPNRRRRHIVCNERWRAGP